MDLSWSDPGRLLPACCVRRRLFGPEPAPGGALPDGAARSGLDPAHFDRSVRVQDDLFRHVNGRWLDDVEIPDDRASAGSFTQIHDRIQDQLQALVDESTPHVTGTVRLKLYKGNIITCGRKSKYSLYDMNIASMEGVKSWYNQSDSTGFIRLNGLRLRARYFAQGGPKR